MSTFITRFDPSPGAAGPNSRRMRVAVKDVIDVEGVPTTNGSRVVAARSAADPPREDAECLAGTRAAEAAGRVVIVGKTNQHELAFGVTGINPWFGTPINPIDARLAPGGSSSGSAAAVAAEEADVAFGSDTGGSIRIPAACCGVVGLKTTTGRVPLGGVLPLAPSLDTIGPMALTVAGAVEGMRLLEPRFEPASTAGVAGDLTVGRVHLPAQEWIDASIDTALAAAGIRVADVTLRGWDRATEAAMTILSAEAWNVCAPLWRHHTGELSADVAARLESASTITSAQLAGAWLQARQWDEELRSALGQVHLLALPTLAAAPPVLGDAARLSELRYTAPFNLAGVPAMAIPLRAPAGQRRAGRVPASLQLVGGAGAEELLCAVAAVIEAVAGYSIA